MLPRIARQGSEHANANANANANASASANPSASASANANANAMICFVKGSWLQLAPLRCLEQLLLVLCY